MYIYSQLSEYVSHLDCLKPWPEMQDVFGQAASHHPRHWMLPVQSCQSFGGTPEQAIPAMAAIACAHIGILLIDDLLDEDPRGIHHQLGLPATANLASAFLAASLESIAKSDAAPEVQLLALKKLAHMLLVTAYGQNLDTQEVLDDAFYWQVVRMKSSPFFGTAFYLGAVMGNASIAVANQMMELGHLYGEIIQIHDDLNDALAIPASPDWRLKRPSLPILFAQLVEHPEREHFIELCLEIDKPAHLKEAQAILIRSGALSYGIDQILCRYHKSQQMLVALSLQNAAAVQTLFSATIRPIQDLFDRLGMAAPI